MEYNNTIHVLSTGTAVCYLGISLIHDLSGLQLAYWLGPALATTGLLLVAGLVLEVKKFMVSISEGLHMFLSSIILATALILQGHSQLPAENV